jgi:hypothetical protein
MGMKIVGAEMRVRFLAAGAGFCMALALAGCASPGNPQPPSLQLPKPVADLKAERVGGAVRLTWTMPERTTDGLLVQGKRHAVVCRRVATAACVDVAQVDAAAKEPARAEDVLPAELASGAAKLLVYEVRVQSPAGRTAGASNVAFAASGAAPTGIAGLKVTATHAGVVLEWERTDEPGVMVALRRERVGEAKKSGDVVAQGEPAVETLTVGRDAGGTVDRTAAFGETYSYTAQRMKREVVEGRELALASAEAGPVTVLVRSQVPPTVPKGLVAAVPEKDASGALGVDLSWDANTEADLAGYNVYRDGVKVNAKAVAAPGFHDAGLAAGHAYAYAVTAVDAAGNESAKSAAAEVQVQEETR